MSIYPNRFTVSAARLLFGHILNPFWYPRLRRRQIREGVDTRWLDRYFDRYLNLSAAAAAAPAPTEGSEEKIYSIWLQGESNAPDLVKSCFASIRKHCSQELVVLEEASLEKMIHLPDTIIRKYKSGRMKPAHYVDICRVELLYEYGGYWLDSTCFVTAPIPEWICGQDFFVYMAGHETPYSYSFIQNCFIRARKGSQLLAKWREVIFNYWMNENRAIDYFQHQLMFRTIVMNDPSSKELFAAMPQVDQAPTHALWWTARKEPYSAESFAKATAGSFFQKTSYRDAAVPVPGTIMFEMIYGNP